MISTEMVKWFNDTFTEDASYGAAFDISLFVTNGTHLTIDWYLPKSVPLVKTIQIQYAGAKAVNSI
jgi:hypothetical protein